ncbi:hypothetical protein EON68_04310, partial [archaeon]
MSGLWSFVSALLEEVAPTADEEGSTAAPAPAPAHLDPSSEDTSRPSTHPRGNAAATPPSRIRASSSHSVRADTFAT